MSNCIGVILAQQLRDDESLGLFKLVSWIQKGCSGGGNDAIGGILSFDTCVESSVSLGIGDWMCGSGAIGGIFLSDILV
jgi:hypothetical protein